MGLFESVTSKEMLYCYGADVNPVSPAEEGGFVAVLLVLLIIISSMFEN